MAQAKYSNSMARFMISSKNGSWYKLNYPKQKRSNFKLPALCKYFLFSCLIRKNTNLGPPDLEYSQKGASGDTHIVYFGPHPICLDIPPPPYPMGHITTLQPLAIATNIAMQSAATAKVHYTLQ
jgi:hypothetical protein